MENYPFEYKLKGKKLALVIDVSGLSEERIEQLLKDLKFIVTVNKAFGDANKALAESGKDINKS